MIQLQGILELPALVMFRNGGMVVIYGDNVQVSFLYLVKFHHKICISQTKLKLLNIICFHSRFLFAQEATEKQLKDWLTSESTLKIIGVIDEVICYDDMITLLRVNTS